MTKTVDNTNDAYDDDDVTYGRRCGRQWQTTTLLTAVPYGDDYACTYDDQDVAVNDNDDSPNLMLS